MKKKFVFICVCVCFLQYNVVLSRQEDERVFRIKKLDTIWRKVQNKMSKNKLNKLREILQTQDVEEMRLKKLKAHGKDEFGNEEARLRANLLDILNQFGLGKYADIEKSRAGDVFETNSFRGQFNDSRLDKLWNIAKDTFDEKELSDLKTEFLHHKDKQLEYDLLNDLLSKHDVSENSVLKHDKLAPDKLEKLRDKVYKKEEDVLESFDRLKEKVEQESRQEGDLSFDDYRVNAMWKKALKAGFSEEELASIKEELQHFDHKIAKHKHYQEQADKSHEMIEEGHEHLREKHKKLQKKAEEHGRWVKKMHKTMMDRITREEL